MSLQKNVAGQKWIVFASDLTTGAAVTGDAANITANLRRDGAALTAVSDLNPTELENGYYVFDLTQAETNADNILITPSSTTADVQVVGSPAALYTSAPNSNAAVISPTGVISADVTAVSGGTLAADNLELMYDGTGYTESSAPASREQVGLLSSGSSAISVTPDSFVLTTGTEAGGTTINDARQLNSIEHRVVDVGDATDFYYEFNVGGDGIPVEFIWDGFVQGGPDEYQVYAYNWTLSDWDQVGELDGTNGEVAQTYNLQATTSHVGSGANKGVVRFRIASTNGAEVGTDRILCSYAVVRRTVGYAQGSIWIDSQASNVNTEPFIDGVADNPVSTMGAALMLRGLVNLSRVTMSPDSSITLTSATENLYVSGGGAALNLNGQSIAGSVFDQVGLNGSDIGSVGGDTVVILNSFAINSSMGQHVMKRSTLVGDITLSEPGTYMWDACASFVAGGGAVGCVFTPGVINHSIRHHSGGTSFMSMTSDHTVTLEGDGQFIIDASCTGGLIHVRGNFEFTDNSGGAVTVVDDARVTTSTILGAMAEFMGNTPLPENAVGAPTATPSFQEAVTYLYSALRNNIDVDANFKEYHNDAGDVLWKKALSDNGTTYSEDEGETG